MIIQAASSGRPGYGPACHARPQNRLEEVHVAEAATSGRSRSGLAHFVKAPAAEPPSDVTVMVISR